jgi:hypothetical protein
MLTEQQLTPHLRALALVEELLERLQTAEEVAIWCHSGTPNEDIANLAKEIDAYRKELEECRHA